MVRGDGFIVLGSQCCVAMVVEVAWPMLEVTSSAGGGRAVWEVTRGRARGESDSVHFSRFWLQALIL